MNTLSTITRLYTQIITFIKYNNTRTYEDITVPIPIFMHQKLLLCLYYCTMHIIILCYVLLYYA